MSGNSNTRRNSILLAGAIAIAFSAWMLSGIKSSEPQPETLQRSGSAASIMRVRVRHSTARQTTRTITVSARTEADRTVEIKAETEGLVVAVGAERGALLGTGQSIVEIDMRDRQARLAEAEALILQRELEYEAAAKLVDQQFISPAELAGRKAQLVAAEAARERIRQDIRHTRILAPFDAIVYDRLVEVGDYVGVGDPIAVLVDTDPIVVVGNINESDIGQLEVGSTGRASLLGGPPIDGTVRYLAPVAEESTRSFRIELAVPNPGMQLRTGTSAELVLGAEPVTVHSVSPAVIQLSLADDGTIGLKTVDNSNRVRFFPVEIVESTPDEILVTGLPAQARIIVVGQGYVVEGQEVIAEEEMGALTQAENERPY